MYDPPHLIKGIRNNFVRKDIEIDFDDKKAEEDKKVGSWDHVTIAYEIDGLRQERRLSKLTDEHVYIGQIKPMKVDLATQVFSSTVSLEVENQAKKQGIFLMIEINSETIFLTENYC